MRTLRRTTRRGGRHDASTATSPRAQLNGDGWPRARERVRVRGWAGAAVWARTHARTRCLRVACALLARCLRIPASSSRGPGWRCAACRAARAAVARASGRTGCASVTHATRWRRCAYAAARWGSRGGGMAGAGPHRVDDLDGRRRGLADLPLQLARLRLCAAGTKPNHRTRQRRRRRTALPPPPPIPHHSAPLPPPPPRRPRPSPSVDVCAHANATERPTQPRTEWGWMRG
jgi:hypothetical protein